MTKTKIKYRASSVGMKEGTLYYQVIHNRVTRQTHTEYKYFPQSGKDIDNQALKKGICWIPFKLFCGENRIRTCEPVLPVTRFPGVPLQPLEHLSKMQSMSNLRLQNYCFSMTKKNYLQDICEVLSFF